jgi:hypothetical protein
LWHGGCPQLLGPLGQDSPEPQEPGPGRKPGIPNRANGLLKDAIIQAAKEAGGRDLSNVLDIPSRVTLLPGSPRPRGSCRWSRVAARQGERAPWRLLVC